MKDQYIVIGSVLKSAYDALQYGLNPPLRISMHSEVKKIYDEEIQDFLKDEIVMDCINACEIYIDDTLPSDYVFSDVPVN